MYVASQQGHLAVVRKLLGRGADPNTALANDGATPVFMASQCGHAAVVRGLLGRGADPNTATTSDGATHR